MTRHLPVLWTLASILLLCVLSARGRNDSLNLSKIMDELDLEGNGRGSAKMAARKHRANRFSSDRKDDEFFVGKFAGHQAPPFRKAKKLEHPKDHERRSHGVTMSTAWTTRCNWVLLATVLLGGLLFIRV